MSQYLMVPGHQQEQCWLQKLEIFLRSFSWFLIAVWLIFSPAATKMSQGIKDTPWVTDSHYGCRTFSINKSTYCHKLMYDETIVYHTEIVYQQASL